MEDLVPFILGVLLGSLIGSRITGRTRTAISALIVVLSGVAATVLSGEFHESWIYLLLDGAEAAVGLALGLLIARRRQRSRIGSRPLTPIQPRR
jgi:hypothetical protein